MRRFTWEQFQRELHQSLELPVTKLQVGFHFCVCLVVAMSLIFYSFIDYQPPLYAKLKNYLMAIELVLAVYFFVELCIRLAMAGMDSRFAGCDGRMRYLCRPLVLFDVLVLLGAVLTVTSLSGTWVREQKNAWAIEYFKFLQLFRFLHLDRKSSKLNLLKKVFYLHRKELCTSLYIGSFCTLLVAATVSWTEGCYQDSTCKMSDYGNTLYWSFMTYLAIGYGEFVPKHWVSKIVTAATSIFLVSIFYLIPSLLGFGFGLMLENRRIKLKMENEQPRAANLIQNFWRFYLMKERFDKIAVYNDVFVHSLIAERLDIVKPNRWSSLLMRSVSLNSFVSTFQKRRCSINSEVSTISGNSRLDLYPGADVKLSRRQNSGDLAASTCRRPVFGLYENESGEDDVSDKPNPSPPPLVSKRTIAARLYSHGHDRYAYVLIAIWYMKFLVSKRRFQLVKTGVDLYDVSLQISDCEAIALTKLRNLQHKIDIIIEHMESRQTDFKQDRTQEMSRRIIRLEAAVSVLRNKVELLMHKLCLARGQRPPTSDQ